MFFVLFKTLQKKNQNVWEEKKKEKSTFLFYLALELSSWHGLENMLFFVCFSQ